ncbi:uncharacterized protein V6R79_026161 [Siganus canaliculatus]
MATRQAWRLKRYGRFLSGSEKTWKVFETKGNKSEIFLTIVQSGYLLVLQGQESLDTVPLVQASDILRVHQKSDILMLRFMVEGESRLIRMQFDGRNRAEAINACSNAVGTLRVYIPAFTQNDGPPPPKKPPTEVSASAAQSQQHSQGKTVGIEPEVVQGPLPIRRLAQHFLGEAALTLPQVYHHDALAQCDLEPVLRICLLDPSFPAFVEKVEGELTKLLKE